MKVVIGVDGSDRSMQSVKFVTQLLCAEHDQISLVFAPPRFNISGHNQKSDVHQLAQDAIVEAVFRKAKAELPSLLGY